MVVHGKLLSEKYIARATLNIPFLSPDDKRDINLLSKMLTLLPHLSALLRILFLSGAWQENRVIIKIIAKIENYKGESFKKSSRPPTV